MHKLTTTEEREGVFYKKHLNNRRFDNELRFFKRAADAGVAPAIIDIDFTKCVFGVQKHIVLGQYLARYEQDHKKMLHDLLLEQINKLHNQVGLCHRDLHSKNVVVTEGGIPLLIDFEFAIAVSPKKTCYDLYGPKHSSIPLPPEHKFNAQGVWWGTKFSAVTSLQKLLGPLK